MAKRRTDSNGLREVAGVVLCERKAARYWENLSQWFAVVMLGVFPFLIGAQTYYNMTKTRYIWFCVLTCAYLFAVLLVALGFLLKKSDKLKRVSEGIQKADISQCLMMGYLLWATISSVVSPYRADTWIGQGRYEGLMTILLYGLTFICLSYWGEYTHKYAYATGIMATVMSLIGILQIAGFDPITPEGYTLWTARFYATIGNIDCVSGVGALVIPALVCAFVLLDGKWRYVCCSGFVLYFYLQVHVNVDSGKIGLAAAAFVTLPFLLDRWKRAMRTAQALGLLSLAYAVEKMFHVTKDGAAFAAGTKVIAALVLGAVLLVVGILLERKERNFRLRAKTVRRIVLAVLLIAVVAVLVLLYTYNGTDKLMTEINQALHGELTDASGGSRIAVWKLSLQFMKEMPIFGSGPDTFISRAKPYYESGELKVIFDFAHNDYLQVGVCLGLVGLAIYLAWIISMAVRLLRKAPENPLLLIFGSAMVGYLGHVFFSFSIALVTPIFWVLAGLGNKCLRQMAPEESKDAA